VPLGVAEDGMFPLQLKPDSSIPVKIIFNTINKQLVVEKLSLDSEKVS
jgi:hypothetical protein